MLLRLTTRTDIAFLKFLSLLIKLIKSNRPLNVWADELNLERHTIVDLEYSPDSLLSVKLYLFQSPNSLYVFIFSESASKNRSAIKAASLFARVM